MKIRDALESDLSSIAELLLIVHQLHVNAHPETYREISHEIAVDFLASKIAEKNAYLRVAEVDSELLGYCSAAIRSSANIPLLQPREFVYVNEVVVRPQSRMGGIGRALIADLKEFARQNGIEEIELDVGHFNSGAKIFFKRQGFEVLRERVTTRG
jgi:ribosomal protein S18 acetylase RimI-like enzyme